MSDFKGILIEDSRLQIKDEIEFGVMSGPAQSTYQPFQAVSISNSNINFNINVPSENICVDRAILLDSDFTFTVQYHNVPVGERCFNWGWTDAFGPFPMQQCFTTVSTTVNNCTTSSNVQDILSMVLRLNDSRVLSSYNSGTPSIPDDSYGVYSDGTGATNNMLAGFQSGGFDSDFVGRGSLKVEAQIAHFNDLGEYVDNSVISDDLADTWVVVFKTHLTEAWQCLNPWSSNYESNESGIIGVNNITFNISVGSVFPQNRFYRTANNVIVEGGVNATGLYPKYVSNITLGAIGVPAGADPNDAPAIQAQTNGFSNTQLLFNFLSFDPSQSAKLKSAKCVLPYIDTPRYLSSATGNPTIPAFGSSVLQTQSLQLNSVNDLIMVGVRVPMSQQNSAMSDSWLTITNISITYNNTSGILASARPIQLFQLSKDNSSSQNWLEFSGQANGAELIGGGGIPNGVAQIPTVGSLLLLNPAKNFNLDPSLSSGSLGQFQLQMSITVKNQFPFGINPEIILIMVNSGVYITQNGQSEVQTGLLTRDVVLAVKKQSAASVLTTHELKRLVGGRMHNKGMFNTHPVRQHLKNIMDRKAPVSEMAHSGGIASGGYASGGIASGGRLRKHIK